jgi:hypothetical protein
MDIIKQKSLDEDRLQQYKTEIATGFNNIKRE